LNFTKIEFRKQGKCFKQNESFQESPRSMIQGATQKINPFQCEYIDLKTGSLKKNNFSNKVILTRQCRTNTKL